MIFKSTQKQSVFQGIIEEYKKYIEFGAIKKGDKLPSCRALAMERVINPNTVERAYSVLEEEGYIKIVPKQGAYVIYEKGKDKIDNLIFEHLSVLYQSNVDFEKALKVLKEI